MSNMSDSEKNYPGSERKDAGKKKDGKKDKKEKGYIMFDADDSDEDLVSEDLKSPSKMKKGKAFRFPKKDIFPNKTKEKEEKKEKDVKKEDKERKKSGDKEGKKHKKDKKKSKHLDLQKDAAPASYDNPVFGVPLTVAVDRNKCHDGIQLPALFRECIDYIEEHGLHCEGIYRISGVKSKVQYLKDCYNKGDPAILEEHEPNIVASLLKQFLRELPEPVLTTALIPKFEEASTIRNERRRTENYLKLIADLPECNRLLLSWMIVHMTHVIEWQRENKMTLQNVSIVLSPTMQISHRVLNVLFSHTKQLFKDTVIKRYIPPLKPATSKWSLELPDNPAALEEELAKQESLLSQLHQELESSFLQSGENDPKKAEQIWEVQRVCTQLKRKIKMAKKSQEAHEKRRKERDEQTKRNTLMEEEEDLRLELREIPDQENLKLELREPPADATETREVTPKDKQDQDSKDEPKPKPTLKELAGQRPVSKSTPGGVGPAGTVHTVTVEVNTEVRNVETEQNQEVEKPTEETVAAEKLEDESVGGESETTAEVETTGGDVQKEEPIKSAETEAQPVETEVTLHEGKVEEAETVEAEPGALRAEDIQADLEEKQRIMLQEDTTDSELGRSVEDVGGGVLEDSEDEFENSLEEILEREGVGCRDGARDSEHEAADTDQELQEAAADTDTTAISPDTEESMAETVLTPVPAPSSVSPPSVTPVPQQVTGDSNDQKEVKEELPEETKEEEKEDEEVDESFDEEEYQKLLEEEYALRLEEEELLAIENELRKKIETEKGEIDRLHQEIAELQYLRQDSDEDISSSSDSSYESEDEEELQDILNQVLKQNEDLEKSNAEMCQKIHEERMICLNVKVQIGLLQQKQLQTSVGSESFLEKDSLIEFD